MRRVWSHVGSGRGSIRLAAALAVGLLALVAFHAVAAADSSGCSGGNEWLGPNGADGPIAGGSWNSGSNWSSGSVPIGTDAVCLPAAATPYSVAVTSSTDGGGNHGSFTASAASLYVSAGATLALSTASDTTGLTTYAGVYGDIVNEGTITIACGGSQNQALLRGATLDNHGTVTMAGSTADTNPFAAQIDASLVNESDGSVDVTAGTALLAAPGGTLLASTSSGTIDVDKGATFSVEDGGGSTRSLEIDAGNITVDGSFQVNGTELIATGGAIGGTNPILLLYGSTLNATGGSGAFRIADGATVQLAGDLGSGHTLTMPGGGQMQPRGYANHGTMTLASSAGTEGYIDGGTLENDGTLDLSSSGGSNPPFDVQTAVTNRGVESISDGSVYTDASPAQVDGTLTVASGATFDPGGLDISGGKIINNGTMPVRGDLHATGGQITGVPPVLTSGGLYLEGSGSGTFDTYGANVYTDIPAGYRVIAEGDLGIARTSGTVNLGTVELHGSAGNNPNIHGYPFDNQGTVTVAASDAAYRVINSTFSNEGTLDVHAGLSVSNGWSNSGQIIVSGGSTVGTSSQSFTQTAGSTTLQGSGDTLSVPGGVTIAGGTLAGAGVVIGNVTSHGAVAPTATAPTLRIQGSYAQAADGVLETPVSGDGTGTLTVTGSASIDGLLQVSTTSGYAPPKDQTYDVLDAQTVTGTFATIAGLASGPYALSYGDAAVTLTAEGVTAPSLPSLSIGDATVAAVDGSTTTATFTVSLSAASASPVTVGYATANGTAVAPDDYAPTNGFVTIEPGATTASITAIVYGSGRAGVRTFFVNLSAPSGATLLNARGTGTILGRLTLATVSPASAGNKASTMLTISGAGLSGSDRVTFTAPGKPDIEATGISATSDGRTLTATVDLRGAAVGTRTVNVTSGTGLGEQSLPDAFTVQAATKPDLMVTIGGPKNSRGGAGWYGHIYLQNLGNTAAVDTTVLIDGLPSEAPVSVEGVAPDPVYTDDGIEQQVTVVVPRVEANSYQALGLSFIPDTINAHVPEASMRATVMSTNDPSLDRSQSDAITAGPATVSNGHLQATVHAASGASLGLELWTATAPTSLARAMALEQGVTSGNTIEFAMPLVAQGCFVNGDPSADVLSWDCSRRGAGASSDTSFDANNGAVSGARSANAHAHAHAADAIDAAKEAVLEKILGNSGYWVYAKYKDAADWVSYIKEHYANGKAALALNKVHRQQALCLQHQGFLSAADVQDLNRLADAELANSLSADIQQKLLSELPSSEYSAALGDSLSKVISQSWAMGMASKLWSMSVIDNHLDSLDTSSTAAAFHWRRYIQILNRVCPPQGRTSSRFWPINTFAGDPNDMSGPSGPSKRHYLNGARVPYTYEADFQNLPTASAPAARVVVTDKLDAARLSPASVALGPVSFGKTTFAPPAGLQSFSTEIDLRPGKNELVDVSGALDRGNDTITWTFTTIDPNTHQPVTDASAGFLPPDVTAPEGEGSVSFTALPTAAGRRNGARTNNRATIVFDANAAIATPVWTNVIDHTRPSARILSVHRATIRRHHKRVHALRVRMRAGDRGAGLAEVRISAAAGHHRFQTAWVGTHGGRVTITCHTHSTYRLRVRAADRVGNRSATPRATRKIRC